MVPNKLQRAEKDLDEFQKKYDSLNQLKPLRENVSFRGVSSWFNPAALRTAKTLWSFGCSECNRVKNPLRQYFCFY